MNDYKSIIKSVLTARNLTAVPVQLGKGNYHAWSAEEKDHNETVIRPFRTDVQKAMSVELSSILTTEQAQAVMRIIIDTDANGGKGGLSKEFEKSPYECFGLVNPATSARPASKKSTPMSFEEFSEHMKPLKLSVSKLAAAYAEALLKA